MVTSGISGTPNLPHIVILEFARPAGYQNYNTVAKKLDRRLEALGASAICDRGLGDDQHPNGYEAGLDPWLRKLWSELTSSHPLPEGISEVSPYCLQTKIARTLACQAVQRHPVLTSTHQDGSGGVHVHACSTAATGVPQTKATHAMDTAAPTRGHRHRAGPQVQGDILVKQ